MIKRIRLNIEEPAGVDRLSWPITQGVPFPDKELRRDTPIRVVDSEGNALPTQSRCLATWNKDSEYVKWLLVDFQVDLKANESSNFFLEYGPEVEPVEPSYPVTIKENKENIVISTGKLELKLYKEVADFFGGIKVRTEDGWRDFFQESPGPFLYMKDHRGNWYDSWDKAPEPTIIIEESGPIRASVCIKGYHASKDSHRFCPYILRIHLFAGRSDLHIFHTFIFDQDPDKIQLSEIGMKFPLRLGRPLRVAFGGDKGSHWANRWDEAQFLQSSDEQYSVILNKKPFAEGTCTRGWANLTGEEGSATVILRDMWKEYPKGFKINGNDVDIQFWPEIYDKPLDFSNPWKEEAVRFNSIDEQDFLKCLKENPTAPLNLKSTGIGDKYLGMSEIEATSKVWDLVRRYAPDRPAAFCDTHTFKAYGTGKTHEFWLHLSPGSISDIECEKLAQSIQEPVIAPPNPDYMCSTGALRLTHPQDKRNFPEVEEALELLFDKLVLEPQKICKIYGMINYGEMVNGHTRANTFAYRLFKNNPSLCPDMLKVLGVFNNEAQDIIHQLWTYFARTGERKYFLFAEAKSEHTEDVDIIHFHPSRPEWIGLMHYHSVMNWSGPPSPSHTLVSGFMLHYYLTGNRRALEVAKEVADCHLRNQEPCGVISNREGKLHREFTGPLMSVLEVYQATWEEKYGELFRRSLDWLRETIRPTGNLPLSVYTGGERGQEIWADGLDNRTDYAGGMLCHILYDAFYLFKEKWLKDWILKLADSWIYDVRCDEYLTSREIVPVKNKEPYLVGQIYKINKDWYWKPFIDFSNNYIDPIISFAYKLTGDLKYAAYLKHRLNIFPGRAKEAYNLLSGEAFEAINHWGYSIPAVMSALAGVDAKALSNAEIEWRKERARRGHPVFDGNRTRYDKEGNIIGDPINMKFPDRDWKKYCLIRNWKPKG